MRGPGGGRLGESGQSAPGPSFFLTSGDLGSLQQERPKDEERGESGVPQPPFRFPPCGPSRPHLHGSGRPPLHARQRRPSLPPRGRFPPPASLARLARRRLPLHLYSKRRLDSFSDPSDQKAGEKGAGTGGGLLGLLIVAAAGAAGLHSPGPGPSDPSSPVPCLQTEGLQSTRTERSIPPKGCIPQRGLAERRTGEQRESERESERPPLLPCPPFLSPPPPREPKLTRRLPVRSQWHVSFGRSSPAHYPPPHSLCLRRPEAAAAVKPLRSKGAHGR